MLLNWNFIRTNIEKIEKSNSKVYLFTWHLGSGKTTLINNLLKNFSEEERKNLTLIINDVWAQNIDFSRLQGNHKDLEMTAISGNGCICCGDLASFEKELEKIRKNEKETWVAKTLIIEPSWIAEPFQMNSILKKFWFSPIITSSLNPFVLKEKSHEELKKYVYENLWISDFITLCQTWSYFDEEAKKILEGILTGKNIRIIPKWSLSIENMTWEETEKNPFKNFLNDLENTSVKQKNFFSRVKEKTNPEITISRKNFPISRYKLVNILKIFGKHLVRAKWTLADNKEFDISFWWIIDIKRIPEIDKNSKTYKITENKNKQFNFIFDGNTPKNILEDFEKFLENKEENKNFYEKYFWSAGIPEIPKESDYNAKIQKLIYQFDEYMDLYNSEINFKKELEEIENIENHEEKAKKFEEIEKNLLEIKNKMNILWDDMKFDNPIIWMQYKNQAYKNSSSEIPTIWALIKHCFKNLDYICGKRIDFFAKHFEKKFGIDIYEIDENMSFDDFLEKYSHELKEICQDEKFMNLWLRYEYFTIWEKTAKWENYRRSKKFYELNLR